MHRLQLLQLTILFLLLIPAAVVGDDTKDKDRKLPVEAKLVAKKAIYLLDLDGKKADEFQNLVKDGEKTGKFPAPPTVDLVLELKNTSDKEVRLWVKGDPIVLNLDVKGPGAMSVTAQKAFTEEFRVPAAAKLAPGQTYSYPIQSLKYGFRGAEKQAYWTEAGEYTITASFKTGISPAPAGTKANEDGFAQLTLTSNEVKVKVIGK